MVAIQTLAVNLKNALNIQNSTFIMGKMAPKFFREPPKSNIGCKNPVVFFWLQEEKIPN